MRNYRCKIRTMNEIQKEELEHFCNVIGIEADITEILPVGQPSKINKDLFEAEHARYLMGEITPMDMMLKFDLSRAGFYKRLKELNLSTKKAFGKLNKANTQESEQYMVHQPEPIQFTDMSIWNGMEVEYFSFDEIPCIISQEVHTYAEQQAQKIELEEDYELELEEDYELELEEDI